MSYKWPNKDPQEILDYSVDWSRWLGGSTISTVTWFVEDEQGVKTLIRPSETVYGITNSAQSNTDTVAIINLYQGINNVEYKFYCLMQDSQGSIAERVIKLTVKEQ